MYQQDVKGKKLSALAGIGMIVLIVLSIVAAGVLEQVLFQLTGNGIGAVVIWGLIGVEIFWMLRSAVREYRYTITADRLFIESRYGDNVRLLYDIPLNCVAAIGTQDEIFEKYGNAQAYDKVFTRGYDVPMSALVYRKDGESKLLAFQPDDEMMKRIKEHIEEAQDSAVPENEE